MAESKEPKDLKELKELNQEWVERVRAWLDDLTCEDSEEFDARFEQDLIKDDQSEIHTLLARALSAKELTLLYSLCIESAEITAYGHIDGYKSLMRAIGPCVLKDDLHIAYLGRIFEWFGCNDDAEAEARTVMGWMSRDLTSHEKIMLLDKLKYAERYEDDHSEWDDFIEEMSIHIDE